MMVGLEWGLGIKFSRHSETETLVGRDSAPSGSCHAKVRQQNCHFTGTSPHLHPPHLAGPGPGAVNIGPGPRGLPAGDREPWVGPREVRGHPTL